MEQEEEEEDPWEPLAQEEEEPQYRPVAPQQVVQAVAVALVAVAVAALALALVVVVMTHCHSTGRHDGVRRPGVVENSGRGTGTTVMEALWLNRQNWRVGSGKCR